MPSVSGESYFGLGRSVIWPGVTVPYQDIPMGEWVLDAGAATPSAIAGGTSSVQGLCKPVFFGDT